eukprot:snap_masked-scaffold_15-processed-gene-1.23-mRNA-1 protein AED:1.00 eAED:1.00 QI:0/-1/0/0/-1/1/1/0/560
MKKNQKEGNQVASAINLDDDLELLLKDYLQTLEDIEEMSFVKAALIMTSFVQRWTKEIEILDNLIWSALSDKKDKLGGKKRKGKRNRQRYDDVISKGFIFNCKEDLLQTTKTQLSFEIKSSKRNRSHQTPNLNQEVCLSISHFSIHDVGAILIREAPAILRRLAFIYETEQAYLSKQKERESIIEFHRKSNLFDDVTVENMEMDEEDDSEEEAHSFEDMLGDEDECVGDEVPVQELQENEFATPTRRISHATIESDDGPDFDTIFSCLPRSRDEAEEIEVTFRKKKKRNIRRRVNVKNLAFISDDVVSLNFSKTTKKFCKFILKLGKEESTCPLLAPILRERLKDVVRRRRCRDITQEQRQRTTSNLELEEVSFQLNLDVDKEDVPVEAKKIMDCDDDDFDDDCFGDDGSIIEASGSLTGKVGEINFRGSFLEILEQCIKSYTSKAANWRKETDFSHRISLWRKGIEPVLAREKASMVYDIHVYGRNLLEHLKPTIFCPLESTRERHDVSRNFLAMLQLVNNGNVELNIEDEELKVKKVHCILANEKVSNNNFRKRKIES